MMMAHGGQVAVALDSPHLILTTQATAFTAGSLAMRRAVKRIMATC
jgi:hypothetical protein